MAQRPTHGVYPCLLLTAGKGPSSLPVTLTLTENGLIVLLLEFFFLILNLPAFGCSHKYYNKNLNTNYDKTLLGNLCSSQVFQESSHLSFDFPKSGSWRRILMSELLLVVVSYYSALLWRSAKYLMISPNSVNSCHSWWCLICFDLFVDLKTALFWFLFKFWKHDHQLIKAVPAATARSLAPRDLHEWRWNWVSAFPSSTRQQLRPADSPLISFSFLKINRVLS